jgi:(heptosyl)LPS beta-1,4-glucosyltransferase
MMQGKSRTSTPFSVAIIALNEEERLPDCLKSVAFADEVLVVDSGSSDRTREVAGSFGARVLVEPWRGFSGQKQFAVDQCSHDWVLILDADERIPEETAGAIRRILERGPGDVSAYRFQRRNYLHYRWIRHSGWWPDPIVRFVDRRRGAFDGRRVHEKWSPRGPVKDLDAAIEHISFRNYSALVAKMERYSSLSARDLFEKNAPVNVMTPLSHALWMFARTYFLELGLLDGFDGLVISIMNAGGSFFKYAKAREMRIEYRRNG